MYVFVWYIYRVVILIQYSLGRYVSQIPSLTYELMNFYYTELLRVLDLSICIGSSRREIGRDSGRERERERRREREKNGNLLVFAPSIQYLYLPTYLTYVRTYHTLCVILRYVTQM